MALWVRRLSFLKLFRKDQRKEKHHSKDNSGLSAIIEEDGGQDINGSSGHQQFMLKWSPQQKDAYRKEERARATLDQSVLRFELMVGSSRQEPESIEMLLTQFLVSSSGTESDDRPIYSLEQVLHVLERKLWRDKGLKHIEASRGRIWWVDETNKHSLHNEVRSQSDFETAISTLFLNRDVRNVLEFTFMPEPENVRQERFERQTGIVKNHGLPDTHTNKLAEHDDDSKRSGPGSALRYSLGSLRFNRLTTTPPLPRTSTKSIKSTQSSRSVKDKVFSLKDSASKIGKIIPYESVKDREARWEKLMVVTQKHAFKASGDEDTEELDSNADQPLRDLYDDPSLSVMDGGEDIEDENNAPKDNSNRIVARLQDLINLPELTQMTDQRWRDCCKVFDIDPRKTSLAETVQIAGLKTKIYQYQAFGAYWQMLTSRHLGGGFLADSMGLGKTLSFLSYFVVERQLCVLWDDVEKSRKENDGRHLSPSQHAENDVCPSDRKPGWILCPCASSNPTSTLLPKSGVRLACVPNELVKSWWGEWKKHVDDQVDPLILGLKIAVNYKGAIDFKTTTEDMNKRADTGAIINRLKKLSPTGNKETHHSGWLVISSAQDFTPWINKHFTRSSQPKGPKYNIEFGIAMIDESHEEYFKQTGRGKVLYDIPSTNQPFLWGHSGTPFSQTPRGLEGVLWAIEKHAPAPSKGVSGWSNHPILKQFQWENLDKICKSFDAHVKTNNPDDAKIDAILDEFVPFLQNFVIRRDAETKWFGHRLIKLKTHFHQDLELANTSLNDHIFNHKIQDIEAKYQAEKDNALAELQAKWDRFPDTRRTQQKPERLAFNTLCRLQWRARVLATIPYASKLLHTEDSKHRIDLTIAETLGFFRRPRDKIKENPYFTNIKSISEASPKLLFIYQLIKILEKGADYRGEEQKLIIMSTFPQIIFVTYMFLLKFMPQLKDRIGVIMPGMKAKDRTDVLEAFTDTLDDKGKRRQARNNLILIGTTRMIGKGLHLTRSAHLVLMEPEYEFVNELQAYGRVHRIGQKNPCSFSFRLINSASDIEKKIIERQKARHERVGRIVEGEELENLDAFTSFMGHL